MLATRAYIQTFLIWLIEGDSGDYGVISSVVTQWWYTDLQFINWECSKVVMCMLCIYHSWLCIIPLFACSLRFSCRRLGSCSSVPEPPCRMGHDVNLAPTLHFQDMYMCQFCRRLHDCFARFWRFCHALLPLFFFILYIFWYAKGGIRISTGASLHF
jgi:hypothetical protein